jgi:hypothetical protein
MYLLYLLLCFLNFHQCLEFVPKHRFCLDALWINRNAGHRAHLNALRFVKMPHAFRAFIGVNLINFWPQVDRLVGALRLTHVAIDALVGYEQCHGLILAQAFDFAAQSLSHQRIHKSIHIARECRDFTHKGAADELVLVTGS